MSIYQSTGICKAKIVLIHGMGDQADALPYRLLTNYLVRRGMNVYRSNLPGHGKADGKRMYVKNWNELIAACDEMVKAAAPDGQDLPLFLAGLSLGGLVALSYAIKSPGKIKGVVAVSPALDSSGTSAILKIMIPLLAAILPRIKVATKLDYKNISRNAEAVKEYTGDQYWQTQTTPIFAGAVLKGIKETQLHASSFSLPIYILQGLGDKIVPVKGGTDFFDRLNVKDKELKQYPDMYHNLFIEPENETVFADISRWLEERV
jgi:alpha-beta hydrolase superfamily lysophospholipase